MYPFPVKPPEDSNRAEIARAVGRIHTLVDIETRNMQHKKSDSQEQLEQLLLANFNIKVIDPNAGDDISPGPVMIGPNSHQKTVKVSDEQAVPKFYNVSNRLQRKLSNTRVAMDQPSLDFNLRVMKAEEPVADEVAHVLKEGHIGPQTAKYSIAMQKNQFSINKGATTHAVLSTVQSSRQTMAASGPLSTPGSMQQQSKGSFRPQIGVRKLSAIQRSNLAKNRMRKRPKFLQQRLQAKDTNHIYPPNQAYGEANQQMQSPSKKRPQSGGRSPDKHAIEVPKSGTSMRDGDSSAGDILSSLYRRSNKGGRSATRRKYLCDDVEKFAKAKNKAEKVDQESNVAIHKAKTAVRKARVKVEESIRETKQVIKNYKELIIKTETDISNKVAEQKPAWAKKTPGNKKKLTPLPVITDDVDETEVDPLEQFYAKKKEKEQQDRLNDRELTEIEKKIEYKFAFGMKIPKDHDWVVKQKTQKEVAEQERRRARITALSDVAYDQNGRRIKHNGKKSLEPVQGRSEAPLIQPDMFQRQKPRSMDRKKSANATGTRRQRKRCTKKTEGMFEFLNRNAIASNPSIPELQQPEIIQQKTCITEVAEMKPVSQTIKNGDLQSSEDPKPQAGQEKRVKISDIVQTQQSPRKAETLGSERHVSEERPMPCKSELQKVPLRVSQFQMPVCRQLSSAMTSSQVPIDARRSCRNIENQENNVLGNFVRHKKMPMSGKSSILSSNQKRTAKKSSEPQQPRRTNLQYGVENYPSMTKLHFANPMTGTNAELRQNGSITSLAENPMPFMDRTNVRSSWIENTQGQIAELNKNRNVISAYSRRITGDI